MKDQLPSPDFDANQYERPSQKWICGRACEGQACRVGPDPSGRCRATYECTPALESKDGATKGHFHCTRPKEYGGPCELGPLPDGTCSRAIPKCQPVRSLRSKRGVFTLSAVALTVAALLLALNGKFRWTFINPGGLSAQHARTDCAHCHSTAHGGPSAWMKSAFLADPGPFEIQKLASATSAQMTTIDTACAQCHARHKFHQPSVVRDHSCSACHREHLGSGQMKPPGDNNCVSCHGNAEIMEASFQRGKSLPAQIFNFRANPAIQQFSAPRPERGYTKVFHSFAADHPEFQIRAENLKETNTLKFNHQRHLADDIPLLNGKRLDCAFCHKPDAAGTYHQKIRFEANCAPCHSLQFDAETPELTVPHGSPSAVRAFLRSLPTQYADYAKKSRGLIRSEDVRSFVNGQIAKLEATVGAGEILEQQIFFSDGRSAPIGTTGRLSNQGRARFAGCIYCHEVTPAVDGAPAVTKPLIPDRWLTRASFDHSRHTTVACQQCHDVTRSRETSDVLLPSKSACVNCHSPQGGVASGCSVCHTYHNAPK